MKTIAVLFLLSGACDGKDIPDQCWGIWNTTQAISMKQPANVNTGSFHIGWFYHTRRDYADRTDTQLHSP